MNHIKDLGPGDVSTKHLSLVDMHLACGALGLDAYYCPDNGWLIAFPECRDCLIPLGISRRVAFQVLAESRAEIRRKAAQLLEGLA